MIKVLIQVESGSCNKKIYNESTLEYKETRHVSRPYPYPYGFILDTCTDDGDNVDCYLITHEELKSGAIVECEPIGLLKQFENEENDHKVLAVLPNQEIKIRQELLDELEEFIMALFAKFPTVKVSVGPILPREDALHHIETYRIG
jgi:inorganic pyrophosphatase